MERKIQDDFMPAIVNRRTYGAIITGVFAWNGDALDTEDEYNRDMKIWERNARAGIKQWKDYKNDGEYLFLAI